MLLPNPNRMLVALFIASTLFAYAPAENSAADKDEKNGASEFWFGVVCHPVTKADKDQGKPKHGLLVDEVLPGSPAEKAGIQVGDVITSFAEMPVRSINDMATSVVENQDKKVSIDVVRDGHALAKKMTIAGRSPTVKFSGPLMPLKSDDNDSDAEKRRILMEAAKRAMGRLHAAKAMDDADRKETPPAPNTTTDAKSTGTSANEPNEGNIATTRAPASLFRESLKPIDGGTEGNRAQLQTAFLRNEGEAPTTDAQQPPALYSAQQVQKLEKRVEALEERLDQVIDQLKKVSPRTNGKAISKKKK